MQRMLMVVLTACAGLSFDAALSAQGSNLAMGGRQKSPSIAPALQRMEPSSTAERRFDGNGRAVARERGRGEQPRVVLPRGEQPRHRQPEVGRGHQPQIGIGIGVGIGLPIGGHHQGHVHTDCCRRWVPPHCETITEKVWIEPRCEREWVPPVFNDCTDHCGRVRRVIVREGYWRTIHHPGRWECVTRTIHVPGRWEVVCGH